MLSRLPIALALTTALLLGGCQNPNGTTNWGDTLLLGAGIGAAALLIAGAGKGHHGERHYAGGYGGGGYGGGGYGRGHRGW